MSILKAYTIPLLGLKTGVHEFDFEVNSEFFAAFEDSPVKDGDFQLKLYLDKRPDEMIVLVFSFRGKVLTECDRCLEDFRLPVKGDEQLVVKYDAQPREEAEVIYLAKGTPELNVARFVYEYIILSLPMIKIHGRDEEDDSSCNPAMLEKLDALNNAEADDDSEDGGSVWDALKGLTDK